jgi:hypothetical protein
MKVKNRYVAKWSNNQRYLILLGCLALRPMFESQFEANNLDGRFVDIGLFVCHRQGAFRVRVEVPSLPQENRCLRL